MKLALGLLLALTACTAQPVYPTQPADIVDSVYKIEAEDDFGPLWSGTAWAYKSDDTGTILVTAGHVCEPEFDEKLHFVIEDRWGEKMLANSARISPKYDLCVVGTTKQLGSALHLAQHMPAYDEPVVMVGAPRGVFGCYSGTDIERCGMAPVSHGNYAGGTLVSLPSTHGYSGSPVLSAGGVVGVLVQGYDGYDSLSFVEPLDHLREFLNEK